MLEQYVRRGECRMSAQIHFGHRREPAEPIAFTLRNEKSSLGFIVFFGYGLERRIVKPCVQRADCGGIAFKGSSCKRVDLVLFQFHDWPFLNVTSGAVS